MATSMRRRYKFSDVVPCIFRSIFILKCNQITFYYLTVSYSCLWITKIFMRFTVKWSKSWFCKTFYDFCSYNIIVVLGTWEYLFFSYWEKCSVDSRYTLNMTNLEHNKITAVYHQLHLKNICKSPATRIPLRARDVINRWRYDLGLKIFEY